MKKIYMKPECRAIYPTQTIIILNDSPTVGTDGGDVDGNANDFEQE